MLPLMGATYEQHDPDCPPRNRTTLGGHSDTARRVADQYQQHREHNDRSIGAWMAARLSDGTSDGVLYETRRDAVRHQHHDEQQYAFINIRPNGMSVCAAASFMRTCRMAYAGGFRLTDPEHRAGGRVLIPRLTYEDQRRHELALAAGLWIPGRNR